ncbi:MAG: phosphoribosylaminoimidazolesuccinocarboxamide synthase [Elusimicrobia bacterium RIFCSPLOWO2_01_FULL_64_13]|nr:MAG: phosphoribosylaminoimidazolesuccinocarboxamide synthase [Elusimicrobia bacterium RIFCSPHIGHO2_01_FULL_64_10]OGR94026.1 MAG: phosphoribosylaminoimidazolesuccinocarboxamide synthase [Elusimicrobia bacterium RIFCSPLOWO2_01_FULL_64_13]
MSAKTESTLDLPLFIRGKVRDVYDLGSKLLMVASDRISAYDVVLPNPIPDKGKVLNRISIFWFGATRGIAPNHLVSADPGKYPEPVRKYAAELEGRSMLVEKTDKIPIECVVRGYLSGSGWKEYQAGGKVCGVPLPPGLKESEKLPEPIFTPATKEEGGKHDENISFGRMGEIVGKDLAERLRKISVALFRFASDLVASRGLILADTKFEFGLRRTSPGQDILLIDECFTPDSSRFWNVPEYRVGISPPSFDKQFVRDYLDSIHWDRKPPAPSLPPAVVSRTREKYIEAFTRITGQRF